MLAGDWQGLNIEELQRQETTVSKGIQLPRQTS
jgi:hypothetical protein